MGDMIQAIRGMNDILPDDCEQWQALEKILTEIVQSYGYGEIRFPLVEKTALFKRTIGEVTDIVEKEMYTFEDRNGDSLSLRPEGTACCIRAGIQNGLFHNQVQRLWYKGPYYRHERPQKGRYRQFHQFGVEAIGMADPLLDVELILMTARFWKTLGIEKAVRLQLNTMGSSLSRDAYRQKLVTYFEGHASQLDEDSQRRLHTNPLRILDSKNPDMQSLIKNAPKLIDHLDDLSRQKFDTVCKTLSDAGLNVDINPTIVRGLDYYNDTVFEWVTDKLGAQGTICAGGRFDGLVEQIGGKAAPACGFALGLERLLELLQTLSCAPTTNHSPAIYAIAASAAAKPHLVTFIERLRDAHPSLAITTHLADGGLKSQFKKADKSGAQIALVLGDDEVANKSISIKYLREDKPQTTLAMQECLEQVGSIVGSV